MNTLGWQIGAFLIGASALIIAVYIGKLLNRKHYYFVPFRQDNPITKPRSLVFDAKYTIPTLEEALENRQIQPILI